MQIPQIWSFGEMQHDSNSPSFKKEEIRRPRFATYPGRWHPRPGIPRLRAGILVQAPNTVDVPAKGSLLVARGTALERGIRGGRQELGEGQLASGPHPNPLRSLL